MFLYSRTSERALKEIDHICIYTHHIYKVVSIVKTELILFVIKISQTNIISNKKEKTEFLLFDG